MKTEQLNRLVKLPGPSRNGPLVHAQRAASTYNVT